MHGAGCAINGCDSKGRLKRGWCNKHYLRWKRYGDPEMVRYIHGDDQARFMSKVNIAGADECWLWNGPVMNRGYGLFLIERGGTRRRPLAHRQAMEWHLGRKLSSDEVVMHACDTPLCVNLRHLSVGTQAENMADMRAKGRDDRSGLAIGWALKRNGGLTPAKRAANVAKRVRDERRERSGSKESA